MAFMISLVQTFYAGSINTKTSICVDKLFCI